MDLHDSQRRSPGRAAAELPGLAGWWVRRAAAHPLLIDTAFSLVLFALVSGRGGDARGQLEPGHQPLVLVFSALLCAPLVLRRRFPLPVFATMCAIAAVQWAWGLVLVADAALLVGLYSVAAQCRLRVALAAAGVLELGVALAVIRWAPPPGVLTAFVFLSGMATAAFVLGVNIRTRRDYLASLEDRAVRAERERDQQAEIAAARERARIAREIHDIVAHNLSVMIALADGAAFAARSGSSETERAARQVSDTGRAALGEMHRLLGVLREVDLVTPRAPQPGIEQIEELLSQLRAAGLTASWTVTGTPFPVPPSAGLAVYRMIQEALTNVLKHAPSSTVVQVLLRYDEPQIQVEVLDDGRDRSPDHAGIGGHGLAGMRERAAMFDGTVTAGPRDHGGWRVHARLDAGRLDDRSEMAR
ncbi:MAG TPA: histidine kinase [Pseudonocardiaceae bacterium]